MNDKVKAGLTLLTLKNPIIIAVAVGILLVGGFIIFIFVTSTFLVAGGFEVEGRDSEEEKKYCVYSFDDKEYIQNLRTNFGLSKKNATNLVNISIENQVDPSLVYAILVAERDSLTKNNIEHWAKRMYEENIKNHIFNATTIIRNMAPEKENQNGQERPDPHFINAAESVISGLDLTMFCSTDLSTIGSPNGNVIIGDGLFSPPLQGNLIITSHFSNRVDPLTGESAFHRGTDFDCNTGDPILSVLDGVVHTATYHNSWGNYVLMDHQNGIYTLSAHMSELHVSSGQTITAGSSIGACGTTGRSTGSHLHFETMVGAPYGTLVNPLEYFNFY